MAYILYDVVINPLPDRQTYIDLFTIALTTPSDDEVDTATSVSWAINPYRLWILAFARELKAYKTQQPGVVTLEAEISTHNQYKSINLGFKNQSNNLDGFMKRWMVIMIVLAEAVNCIYNGQPGNEVENPESEVHLVIATTTDGNYAGHITYYDNPSNSTDLVFIAIYKSVYCKTCPNFSEALLKFVEAKAQEMGKKTIHTRPIGPMSDILIKHGFEPQGAAYVKTIVSTGGRRSRRSTRRYRRSRSYRRR